MKKQERAQWSVSGIVEAPVEHVWAALLELTPELSPADRQAITHHPTTQPYRAQPSGAIKVDTEVDYRNHKLTTQGEWWYRGVTSVESHPRGSLVVYRVTNIAPGVGWWVAQLVQGPEHARNMKPTLQQLLTAIGKTLACNADLVGRGA